MQGFLPPFKHFATTAIHVGQDPEQWRSGAVVPPITLSTTFKQRAPGEHAGYEYARSGNPTRDCLEKAAAALDGAKYCLAYSSGLAALLNICHLLKTGDTVICMDDVYGGTNRYFQKVASENNLKVVFVDCTKPKSLEAAITPDTKLVWLETPTNPTLKVIDIKACADTVHRHPGVLLAVDNSFMSAYFQRPLSLGADISMSSGTKYINGHSDVLMGLVSVNRDDLYERLKFLQNCKCRQGIADRDPVHSHSCCWGGSLLWSSLGVLPTLPIPGLPSHPQYEVTKKQCTGCPGMIALYIKGNIKNASAFLKSLKVFSLAESLGGFESLAEHPAIMTHASVPEEERKALGISDTLIRLSVGLEDEEDLIEDLGQDLKAAVSGEFPPK
ncbi:CGL lyase, partial [Oenanthe oenanthe]|nr:CGL lyase [Oenanthe oenanthe]